MLSILAALLSFCGAFVTGIQIENLPSPQPTQQQPQPTTTPQKALPKRIPTNLTDRPGNNIILPLKVNQQNSQKFQRNPNSSLNNNSIQRIRRETTHPSQRTPRNGDADSGGSHWEDDEIGWTIINQEVDMVVPLVLLHFNQFGISHLQLPDMTESISVKPIFITYSAGLSLYNGTAYNIAGISRNGNAIMTYKDKLFLCKFYLIIRNLQFSYDFLIKLMSIEGYGQVVGSLEDTLIYANLSISVTDTRLRMDDFRIVHFSHINVQLNHQRLIRDLTGAILTPITNLFRDRITTSISDGMKDQMQLIMDDFNDKDPLELRKFTKQILSSLTGTKD